MRDFETSCAVCMPAFVDQLVGTQMVCFFLSAIMLFGWAICVRFFPGSLYLSHFCDFLPVSSCAVVSLAQAAMATWTVVFPRQA